MKEEDEPEEEEEEELGHAETYAEYMPMKCKCCAGGEYIFFISLQLWYYSAEYVPNLMKPHFTTTNV